TRFSRDWSSDVCLQVTTTAPARPAQRRKPRLLQADARRARTESPEGITARNSPSRPATTAARPALMARDAVDRARRRVPLRGWLATLRVLRRAMLNLLGCEYAGDA